MNIEIEGMIKKCSICLTFRNRQSSKPIMNHPVQNQAWKKVAADPFCLYRHYYLMMIDYYSKFTIIETLENLQPSTVINKCKNIFNNLGPQKS